MKRKVLLKQDVLDTKIKFISDFTEGQSFFHVLIRHQLTITIPLSIILFLIQKIDFPSEALNFKLS